MTRRLPHDLDAEASVIGGVILRNHVLRQLPELDAEDFFDWKHNAVWNAIRALARQQKPIDSVTLEDALRTASRLDAVGGVSFLGRLCLRVPTADHVRHYADIVRRHARARRLMLDMSAVVEAGYNGTDPDELLSRAQRALRGDPSQTIGFASAALRIRGEAVRRQKLVSRELAFNVTFLDDYLRSVLPHDLILVGAYTGAGKTQLVQHIATTNAQAGKRVYLLALEAEPDEIERRTKFGVLAEMASTLGIPGRHQLNYPDWYRGRCPASVARYEADAEAWIVEHLATLSTLYRGRDFHLDDIEDHFHAIRDHADLIILDHLHYVDSKDGNENRAVKSIVKRIRDVSLAIGVPVIVVAHLRKKDRFRPTLVPHIDDFHGTSDITKIATAAILLSRARDQESNEPWLANTYLQVPKSRMAGQCPYIAMMAYDLRRNVYEPRYALGRLNFEGTEVEALDAGDYPSWARSASHTMQ